MSLTSETRTLQLPLEFLIVAKPVDDSTVHAVLVLASKLNVPVKFGIEPTPKDRLVA